jgi:hypothetical protein
MLLDSLLALILALHPWATNQFPSETPQYSVRGTVVNSATGEPIRGALVQLFAERQRSQLTGPDGQFLFESVPAGVFSCNVQKPGFFSSRDVPASKLQAPMINVGPDAPPMILRLIPEGLIYGRISGDSGEPIESLPVQLFFERIENGKRTRAASRSASTNEEGQFRLPELLPGKYFILAGPTPTAVLFTGRLSQQGAQGYPAVFYPGVPDLSSANAIEITPGKRVEINFALSLQPFYRVSGTVSGFPSGQGFGLQLFNAAGQPMPFGFEADPGRGAFRSEWIPAGPVTITASSQDAKSQQMYFASQTTNVTSDRAGVHLTLLPSIMIPVNMRLERTHNDSPPAQTQFFMQLGPLRTPGQEDVPARIALTESDHLLPQNQYGSELIGTDESRWLGIRNVPPGAYSVQIFPNGPYYVQSARSGSLDLLERELTVTSGGSVRPIDIVLRDDVATLSGTVSLSRKRVFATVLAVPVSNPGQVLVITAGSDGSFQFGNLAPGPYKLLAVDHVDDWEYGNPEVLRKYLSNARDIVLGPNQSASVELQMMRIEEQGL